MLAILMQRETSVEVVMHCVLVQGKWEGRGHMLKAGNILQCILWYANRLFELCDAAVVTKPRNGKKKSAANAIITTKGCVVVISMPRLRRGKEVRLLENAFQTFFFFD